MADGSHKLGRNVISLGVVSFFTDVASDMMYPLLPVFLASVLGASASFIGVIEGAAESVAALLKLASGWWSDRVESRKGLVLAGYVVASVVRPFTAVTHTASQVLGIRVTDRVGKGIRSTPRDALIADSVDASIRGRAFGFHAAADNAGAVVGPLIAFAVLYYWHAPLRTVFWLTAIPGAIAVIVLWVFVRDIPHAVAASGRPHLVGTDLSGQFWGYLVVVFAFTIGNSTDAFLLLRARQLGVPVALAPVLWALLNFIKSATGTYGGGLSDRIGRKPLIVGGWLLYSGVYLAFGIADAAWQAWALFAVYGVFYGMTEGTEKAMVVDIVPARRKGTALGWYNLAIGIGALPASLIFGAIWDRVGAPTAFMFGAAVAFIASVGMAFVGPRRGARIEG
ncbi:MAG: MFS transporter [Gemmatimonadaceae bacterium]